MKTLQVIQHGATHEFTNEENHELYYQITKEGILEIFQYPDADEGSIVYVSNPRRYVIAIFSQPFAIKFIK